MKDKPKEPKAIRQTARTMPKKDTSAAADWDRLEKRQAKLEKKLAAQRADALARDAWRNACAKHGIPIDAVYGEA